MKNKHKRQFLETFKWFDHSFLLNAIQIWCLNASKQHLIKGHHVNNARVSRSLKIAAELSTRLQEANYEDTRFFVKTLEQDHETNPIEGSDLIALKSWLDNADLSKAQQPSAAMFFTNRRIINKETKEVQEGVSREQYRKEYKRQIKVMRRKEKETLDLFCSVFKKNLYSWWD